MVDLWKKVEKIEMAVNDFGKLLHDYRINNNISLQQMSDRVSLTPSYLWRIENGKRKPDFDVRIRILTIGMQWSVLDVILYLEQVIGIKISKYQSN